MPVERNMPGSGRSGGDLSGGEETQDSQSDRASHRDVRRGHENAREDRAAKNREIGARLDETRAPKHLVTPQVLRKDGVFDRPEEGRMDAHRADRGEHQRDIGEHDSGAPADHDPDLGELDDSDQPRLVVVVGELARESGKQKEGQDEQALRDRAELKLLRRIRIELIGDEQHDRLLEQAVVEGSEELRRKKRQEAPRTQQVSDVLDQA